MVGLVEHGDLDRRQVGMSGLHMIFEAAWAGDDDVDSGTQLLDLRLVPDAAEDDDRTQIRRGGQRRKRGVDLCDQLAGRGEDERPRTTAEGASWGCL